MPSGCWNTIGVRGDGSCPELKQHVHCRNCPVYSAGAAELLDAHVPVDYFAERTSHFARPLDSQDAKTRAVVVFRIGAEWLALPTEVVTEVANLRPIHSLPHQRTRVVLGLASVRGELLICVSLGQVIGVEPAPAAGRHHRSTVFQRLLVIRREDVHAACPVDEVYGIHRFHTRQLENVPATVAQATVAYSTGLLPWNDHMVGVLDDQLVFYTVKRSLG